MDESNVSLRQGSFYVDPSDGLCTLVGSEYLDQSTLNQTKRFPGDTAFCNADDGDSKAGNSHQDRETTDNVNDKDFAEKGYVYQEDGVYNENDSIKEQTTYGDVTFFHNPKSLSEDMRTIINTPEFCDVTFVVGKTKSEVYGVKAILATRSRHFLNLITSHQRLAAQEIASRRGKKPGLFSRLFRRNRSSRYQKMGSKTCRGLEIPIEEFDVDIFQRVMVYLHSGRVHINPESVVGVMNAADTYGLPDLRTACFEFAHHFIQVNTVLSLLVSTEAYAQYKWTRILAQRLLEFISNRAEAVLCMPEFESLPKSTVVMILLRRDLRASEETKWTAALQWSRRHCQKRSNSYFRRTVRIFAHNVNFIELPKYVLENEVRPLGVIPDDVIMEAFAQQTRDREVIGQEQSRVAPPKPPRRKQAQQNLRRSAASAAAILAPLRGFVRTASSLNNSKRRSQCMEDDEVPLKLS
ncbi:serine-enriched protein-like [Liolophura sinensis]|uniref:serine-enriched protein-like n=1 Tax=Liolophura sinensis TaxID=3198878 RepID=UPI003158BEB6